jgi:hypothetical protein
LEQDRFSVVPVSKKDKIKDTSLLMETKIYHMKNFRIKLKE